MSLKPKQKLWIVVARHVWPWMLVVTFGLILYAALKDAIRDAAGAEEIKWRNPRAPWLLIGAGVVGVIAFHLHRRRSAAMGFTQVGLVGKRGWIAWLSDLPSVLRVCALGVLAVALGRPETYRTVIHQEDSIDIMIVFDMSKSMEEEDIPHNRMDAAQRVIRRFLRRTKSDNVGLAIFGRESMLHTPLTHDMKMLDQIVRDLRIGDVPELGTAIGDGLAQALTQLRRSDITCDPKAKENTCPGNVTCTSEGKCGAKSKIVILLSDGDNNWVTRFDPDEAARTAKKLGVKVYTVLVGREDSDMFGGMSVNPQTLRSIAQLTGGEFFRATDYESFDKGFQTVRNKLDKTKRERKERLPDKQLFVILVGVAAALIAAELLLSYTRLRRLP